ncbi:MAG: Gfo/Idh/MocA family oxidoreductase [Coriobacteriales bacterium]|jgi:predicted dehydrogenase|nr:Gfo/Idh/MocA family oxidoreductase [Coriobacteriales bacterium]
MSDLKYALIGCGRISQYHLAAALENGLKVEALCDIYPPAMDVLAEEAGLSQVRKYTDHREMLEKEDLDLVAITTKSSLHAATALDCIRKGVHVIIEKPLALSLADADEIIKESAAYNVKVCSCHQNRFNKPIQKLRSAVEGGDFGKLLYASATIRWSRSEAYYKQAAWRGTWAEDGGTLMNQCVHNIDLLRWMMGNEITEVFAYTDQLVHDYIEGEDFGIALIKFANGSYGVLEGTSDIYEDDLEETLSIFGTQGTVQIGGKSLNLFEHWQFKDSVEELASLQEKYGESPRNIYGFGHLPLYADMIAAIRDNRKPYIDAVDGRNAIELILAIYKSSAEGKPVKLPIKDVATLDFVGRF